MSLYIDLSPPQPPTQPPSLPPHITNEPYEPEVTTERTITISFPYLILSMITLYIVPLTICLIIIIRFRQKPIKRKPEPLRSGWNRGQSSWYSGFISNPYKGLTNISIFKSVFPSKYRTNLVTSLPPSLYKSSPRYKEHRQYNGKYLSVTRNNYVRKRSRSPERISSPSPRK